MTTLSTPSAKYEAFKRASNAPSASSSATETHNIKNLTPEDKLTIECRNEFLKKYPYLHKNFWHTANENYATGKKGGQTGAKRQAMGLVSGVSDFSLMLPIMVENGWIHGLFIELKCPGNYQIPSQKEFEEFSIAAGYMYRVCRSVEEFMKLADEYIARVDPAIIASLKAIYAKWEPIKEKKEAEKEMRKLQPKKSQLEKDRQELAKRLGISPDRMRIK